MFDQKNITIAQYRPCRCFELAGLALDLRCTGERITHIRFPDRETICILLDGQLLTSSCIVSKAADDLYFVHAELPASGFRRGISFAYDAAGGSVTFVLAMHGHLSHSPRAVEHEILFASDTQRGDPPEAAAPHFTDLLVGRRIEYRYSEGFVVQHRYLSEHSMEWTITEERFFPEFAGIPHTEHCDAVWLRPDALLFSWLETQSGTQGAFVLNTVRMRTTGAFFGVGPDGLPESYPMGAFAVLMA